MYQINLCNNRISHFLWTHFYSLNFLCFLLHFLSCIALLFSINSRIVATCISICVPVMYLDPTEIPISLFCSFSGIFFDSWRSGSRKRSYSSCNCISGLQMYMFEFKLVIFFPYNKCGFSLRCSTSLKLPRCICFDTKIILQCNFVVSKWLMDGKLS